MWTGWPFKGANSEQRAVINHVQQALQSAEPFMGGTEGMRDRAARSHLNKHNEEKEAVGNRAGNFFS